MGDFEGIQRLLLIIAEGVSESIFPEWITKLPFLGTHYYQGFSAIVNALPNTSKEEILSYFKSGTSDTTVKDIFWDDLTGKGLKVALVSAPQLWSASNNYFNGDLSDLIKREDWQLLITPFPLEEDKASTLDFDSDLEFYGWLDKGIEDLALSAGSQTVIMVLSLPEGDKNGWMLSGGAQIAASGTPGMVELIDIPKTILWLLGVEIPARMDGQLIEEILDTDLDLSQEEMDLLTDHLRGLGYLG